MPGRVRAHASAIGAIYDRISPAVEDAMIVRGPDYAVVQFFARRPSV